MITMFVKSELVQEEYLKESEYLLNILRNSESKYKDTPLEKINWTYSFSYFVKKGGASQEYYENLYKMSYSERCEAELKKVKVNIGLSAGYFYISDRVNIISDTIKEAVNQITAQKMINEQEFIGDESILESIPIVVENNPPKPTSLQEQLKRAIEIEDYMEAARIRDEIKKSED